MKAIRLSDTDRKACQEGHRKLRELLEADTRLGSVIITSFLQGSYHRATAIKPHEGKKSDVDVIIVTMVSELLFPIRTTMGLVTRVFPGDRAVYALIHLIGRY